jgi:ABC-type transport system involved in cytochrome bd biosynthesis fused ATPase/permease subunit
MLVVTAFRSAIAVSSAAVRGRAGIIAALVLGERLLAPAAAYAWLLTGARKGLPLAVLASVILALRGATQRSFAARNEAELYRGATVAILEGDVLQPTILPNEEARTSLFQAVNRASQLLAEGVPDLVASIFAALLLSAGGALLEPLQVTLVAVAAVGVGALVVFTTRGAVDRAQIAAWNAMDTVVGGIEDACDGRLELAAAGRVPGFLRAFATTTTTWERKARRARRLASFLGRMPLALLAAAVAGAVLTNARLQGSDWSVAAIHAALLASCAPAFFAVARGLQELTSNAPRLRLLEEILVRSPSDGAARAIAPAPPRQVEWRDIHFAYADQEREVLRGVSFVWRAGELVALAGANGSGKSTCLRVALGLGRVTGGALLVDDAPLRELEMVSWRQSVTFLPQRPHLPPRATVRECLRFLDADVTDERMLATLDRVGLLPSLARANGDPLAARVGQLSAGERQRVALARVLCRQAPLVLLDEPDTNLDRAGIELLSGLIVEMSRDRMVMIAAHAPELLARADRVVTLEDGAVLSDVRPMR